MTRDVNTAGPIDGDFVFPSGKTTQRSTNRFGLPGSFREAPNIPSRIPHITRRGRWHLTVQPSQVHLSHSGGRPYLIKIWFCTSQISTNPLKQAKQIWASEERARE
jgi:hypothetical protein